MNSFAVVQGFLGKGILPFSEKTVLVASVAMLIDCQDSLSGYVCVCQGGLCGLYMKCIDKYDRKLIEGFLRCAKRLIPI